MSHSGKALLAALCSAVLLFACAHGAPKPVAPPPAPGPHVPPGCEQNLTGRYQHARDPAYVYDGQDDGGTLVLALKRTDTPPSDAGWASTRIVLTRTPDGFNGATRTTAFNSLHQSCAVALPTQLIACGDGGLTLRSAEKLAIDPSCQPSATPPQLVDQTLVRTVDAGT